MSSLPTTSVLPLLDQIMQIQVTSEQSTTQTLSVLRNLSEEYGKLQAAQARLTLVSTRLKHAVQYVSKHSNFNMPWNRVLSDVTNTKIGLVHALRQSHWSANQERAIRLAEISLETIKRQMLVPFNTIEMRKGECTEICQYSSEHNHKKSVYLVHAGEDKEMIVRPLWKMLREEGINSFLDKEDMKPGEEKEIVLKRAMDDAEMAVIILSPELAAKKWPMAEVAHLLMRCENEGHHGPFILPIFYRLRLQDIKQFDFFASTDENGQNLFVKWGFFERAARHETSVRFLMECFKAVSKRIGIENMEGATNEDTVEMQGRRSELLSRIKKATISAVIARRIQDLPM